jgi:N-acetylmuramoyl-L-alanine amidase
MGFFLYCRINWIYTVKKGVLTQVHSTAKHFMTYSINSASQLSGNKVDLSISALHKNSVDFDKNYPDSIIIHYTAGRDAKSSATFLAGTVKASAHLVIGRDGTIYQLIPFNKIAWHAGESTYDGRSGFNNYSIGIELDNAGPLTQIGNRYQSWFKEFYPEHEVFYAVHRNETAPRYWHSYTAAQVEVCEEICQLLINRYPNIRFILGHEEISIGRKTDPGPAFPLDNIRERLLTHDRSKAQGIFEPFDAHVAVDKLNIREGSGVQYKMVAQPLSANHPVKVIEEQNGWYQVETTIKGWVHKGFISK